MKPYRTSLSARIVSAGAAFALIAAGLVPILGLPVSQALPVIVMITFGAGLIGLLAGIRQYTEAVILLALLLPMGLWAFTLAALVIINAYPSYGWALIAIGSIPIGLLVASLGTRAEPAPVGAPRHA
jgi:hypothetical protein